MESYYICPKCQIDKSDLFLKQITNLIKPILIFYNNKKYKILILNLNSMIFLNILIMMF